MATSKYLNTTELHAAVGFRTKLLIAGLEPTPDISGKSY